MITKKNKFVKFFYLLELILFTIPISLFASFDFWFVETRDQLEKISDTENIILVASLGRLGSTMLYETLLYQTSHVVLKTHCLPPKASFKGKIIFIFSNPNISVESALHLALTIPLFGIEHFRHMEGSDQEWLDNLPDSTYQNISHNLLCYDALGYTQHLSKWLHEESVSINLEEAQILAIKYENLWDEETINALKMFLLLDELKLPEKLNRACWLNKMTYAEKQFREMYNLGTLKNPRYAAYDEARTLWELAPPFQFLKIVKQD